MPKFTMKRYLPIIILTSLLTTSVKGQSSYQEMQQLVLKNDIKDSLYVFGKWTADGSDETNLRYLGKIETNTGQILKIMNSSWFWGLSHRAISRILIFNGQNQYLGNFYLYTTSELPDRLQNGKLIFENSDNDDCDKKLTTVIDFYQGIPKDIFIKCKNDEGNLVVFSTE
jgi:hypothetical protein